MSGGEGGGDGVEQSRRRLLPGKTGFRGGAGGLAGGEQAGGAADKRINHDRGGGRIIEVTDQADGGSLGEDFALAGGWGRDHGEAGVEVLVDLVGRRELFVERFVGFEREADVGHREVARALRAGHGLSVAMGMVGDELFNSIAP